MADQEAAHHVTEPIEVAAPGDVDDGEFDELEWDGSSAASTSTSITSSILQHSYENGRRYHRYRHGKYPIPNDDVEQGRESLKHAVALELLDGKLSLADIGASPQKVLDFGTGVGTWAIDFADQYPSAEVIGVDLSPIQSSWVPPNLKFIVDDIEDEWTHGNDYDLIHSRHVCPAMKDVENVARMAFDNLKPGGWWESSDFAGYIKCDDGSMPPDAPLAKFMDLSEEAFNKFGLKFRLANHMEEPLKKAGFVNISCYTVKTPIGTWPKDSTLRLIGQYMVTIMSDLMGAIGAKPLRMLGMSPEEIEVFLAQGRRQMKDATSHQYLEFKFWTAQKPLDVASTNQSVSQTVGQDPDAEASPGPAQKSTPETEEDRKAEKDAAA